MTTHRAVPEKPPIGAYVGADRRPMVLIPFDAREALTLKEGADRNGLRNHNCSLVQRISYWPKDWWSLARFARRTANETGRQWSSPDGLSRWRSDRLACQAVLH
jgi:hypothetical protein